MESISRDSIIKALKNFRFIVVESGSESMILEYLRSIGVVSLFQIHRMKGYTIIEPNTTLCERECNLQCMEERHVEDCKISCMGMCIDSRVAYVLERLSLV